MEWDAGTYTVAWKGHQIKLLPKEYALLAYFYQNEGLTLSREQLLDAVWKLESPVDRTVDDHVYRLRRKLALWAPDVAIETVRGLGYRLRLQRQAPAENPLLTLPSLSEELNKIAGTYLRYGKGEALLTLARYQHLLGFQAGTAFASLIRLMEGDVQYLVREDIPFAERGFFLLFWHQYIDPQKNRRYVETVIRKKLLAQPWQFELESLTIIRMLMDWGEFDSAKEKLYRLASEVESRNWEGLVPYMAILRLEMALRAERWTEVEAAIEAAEEKLKQFPYQREMGHYRILKGISKYPADRKTGLKLIDDGLTMLKQSRFVANLLASLDVLLKLTKQQGWGADRNAYVKEWSTLTARLGLDEIGGRVREQLKAELDSL